ncbi:MAG: SGNH/GDSL hydrolase family protein [Acidimicrobiales bacterium]
MTGMSGRRLRCLVLTCLGVAVLAASFGSPIARAELSGPLYVAMGDSFTAAPLSSVPVGTWGGDDPFGYNNPANPYTCGRSTLNYPHLIAQHLGLHTAIDGVNENFHLPANPRFRDVSCGGATTKDMYERQYGLPFEEPTVTGEGYNEPQLDALDKSVKLVTLGIGGNDIGFGDLQNKCVEEPLMTGTPCRKYFENGPGGDILLGRIAKFTEKLDKLLADIHSASRAPNATILVFGYPALLPEHRPSWVPEQLRDGCYPYIPILPTDAAYLVDIEKALNASIRQAAQKARDSGVPVRYVDWYTPSIGHDMCKPPGLAWVNGIVLAPPSYPVHPNALGTMGGARAGIKVLEQIGFAP